MGNRLFTLLLALVPAFSAMAAPPPPGGGFASDSFPDVPEIDQAVLAFMAANNVPGVSLAITRDEELVYAKGYGYADRENYERVTTQSLFRIASISKPMTAIAILQLVEQKKLSLDQKVFGPKGLLGTRYGTRPYSKWITDITVRHLLQHLAGGWGNTGRDPMFLDKNLNLDQLITYTLDSIPLKRAPGTQYEYSNFGYCLLGRIIEKLTGMAYADYMQEYVFKRAGVTTMQIGGNTVADRKPNEVKYYGYKNENPDCCNVERMDAHGGWIASAIDLVKVLAHVDGLGKVKDILSPESIKLMGTAPDVSPRYALGWAVDSLGNWSHGGSLPGTRTDLRRRNNGYGYALLMNTRSRDTGFNNGMTRLINRIMEHQFFPADKRAEPVSTYRPPVFAEADREEKIISTIPVISGMYRDFAKRNQVPGLAYGIVSGGKLIHAEGIGYSDVEKKIPVTENSVYRIASMTKSFAAMAILILRDDGKLRLDDPVARFVPELQKVRPLTSDSPPITIAHLLSHTAGFPEDNPWADRQLERRDEELTDLLKAGVSLSNTPGMGYEYSNLGFAMLGTIITRASGMHYEQFIQERIFKPLGMRDTYWEYSEVPASQLVHGYRMVNGKWRKEPMLHRGAYGVMGGLLTSVADFARYMNFHLSAWPARSGPDEGILKRSSVREMHLPAHISSFSAQGPCPRVSSYNFGLSWSRDCSGKEQIGHSGGLPGFGTHWTMLPHYDLAVVAFSNLTYSRVSALNAEVIDSLIRIAGIGPRRVQPSAILNQRRDELMALLPHWKNAPQSPIFAENFFSDYFVDSLRKEAESLFRAIGAVRGTGPFVPENQLRGTFTIEGEKGDLLVRITLSPESPARIQHYSIQPVSKHFSKYRLHTVSTMDRYLSQVRADPRQELVRLDSFIPGITLDIRYATDNNIMKRPVYGKAAAYLRRPAAEALKKVQEALRPLGYGLKIYDGYRPYDVTVLFYETFHDTTFVASPYSGSRHNRGCAVDLTLIDLKTGQELEMPTPYDTFSEVAHSRYPHIPEHVRKNRDLLQQLMLVNGFLIYPDEWWHFDFEGWRDYPVMDIPFETLEGK